MLVLERLRHRINNLVNTNIWKTFSIGRGSGPKNSYVCFADDIVLLDGVSVDQTCLIHDNLHNFCTKSNVRVNLYNSKYYSLRMLEKVMLMFSILGER